MGAGWNKKKKNGGALPDTAKCIWNLKEGFAESERLFFYNFRYE